MGEKKKLKILVDTGAEVNLIKSGIFDEKNFAAATKPITLVTVSGDKLAGGQSWGKFCIKLKPLDEENAEHEEVPALDGMFYEADIAWDMIVGYPLLASSRVGIFPHHQCLIQDLGGGKFQKSGEVSSLEVEDGPEQNILVVQEAEKCDYAVNMDLVKSILDKFDCGTPTVDSFAAEHNKRFDRFWSKKDSAWSKNWGTEKLIWCNPPFEDMSRVVEKFISDKAKGIIIAPKWDHPWWNKLMAITVDDWELPAGESIFERPGGIRQPPPP